MTEVITIITLVATIISPLLLAIAYGIRKIRKSTCWGCSFDSTSDNSPINIKNIDFNKTSTNLKVLDDK